ncbi:MAG TPA: hypothetical protein DCS24_08160 [Erythrobacter sp.]|nr:hypothetical protein [Erythrobacter sp.]
MANAWHKGFCKDQSGAVAASYALALVPLLAIAGLAYDYTRLVGMDTELQNAADQAALAGASQLTRRSGSMEAAIAAIQGGLVSNSTRFSNDGTGSTIDVSTAGIVFYNTKADAEAGTNGFTDTTKFTEAGFVQVTVETRSANFALTPIVGAVSEDLTASAVAGLGSAACRVPPLMICNPDEPLSGDASADFIRPAGIGILAVRGDTGQSFWEPGNFGYLDLGNGANGVRAGMGWTSPEGACLSLAGVDQIEVDIETGLKTDATDSVNTRFDLFDNVACPAGGECPAAFNSRKDLVRDADDIPASGNACKIHNDGWHEVPLADQYLPATATPLPTSITPKSMGHPRDMCHAVSNAGNCTDGPLGDGNWDRDAYFRSHYIRTSGPNAGTTWTANDWQTNTGLGTSPTRYQVYKWEETNAGLTIDGVEILGQYPAAPTGSEYVNHAKPVCSQQEGYSGTFTGPPDRRKLSVAVINCRAEGVNGKSVNVPVHTWIDVFLVQPSKNRERTNRGEVYVEYIGKSSQQGGSGGGLIVRRDVPYLVR